MPNPKKRIMPDPNEPGVQDATVSDFLLPYLLGKLPFVNPQATAMGRYGEALKAPGDVAGSAVRDAMMKSASRPAMAKGGVVSPYPEIEQELEEEGTEGSSDETNDPEFEEMPHLAKGGFSLDDNYNVNTGDSSTVKGAPIDPATLAPVEAPVEEKKSPTSAPIATPSTPPPIQKPLPGMPPTVTPDELKSYLGNQRMAVNKYNPDQQYAREQQIMAARRGILPTIAHAAATFAGPEYAKAQDDRWNDLLQQNASSFANARKSTLENMETNQKIDMNDPTSPISRMTQKAFGPQLIAAGLPASAISHISASLANEIATKQVTLAEALARVNEEATYHRGMLENTRLQREQDKTLKKESSQLESAKGLQGRPWYQKLIETIPGLRSVATEEMMSNLEADPKNDEALQWIKENSNDPRAPEILRRLMNK